MVDEAGLWDKEKVGVNPRAQRAELYHIKHYPEETRYLANDVRYARRIESMRAHLDRLIKEADGWPDRMSLDEGIKTELPEESIR